MTVGDLLVLGGLVGLCVAIGLVLGLQRIGVSKRTLTIASCVAVVVPMAAMVVGLVVELGDWRQVLVAAGLLAPDVILGVVIALVIAVVVPVTRAWRSRRASPGQPDEGGHLGGRVGEELVARVDAPDQLAEQLEADHAEQLRPGHDHPGQHRAR